MPRKLIYYLHNIQILTAFIYCSSSIHHNHIPVPVRRDVRRRWPRPAHDHLRPRARHIREEIPQSQDRQRNLEHFLWRKIHHPPHGTVLYIHGIHIQRFLLQVTEYIWEQLEECVR